MIRDATFADIPRIVAIMREAYERSRYAKEGLCGFDEKEGKRLLVNAIQRHGRGRNSASFVQVAVENDRVEGFIIGFLSRVYHCGDKLVASDLFWYATPLVSPRDPIRLMKNMIAWAKGVDGVIEIRCGATAAVQNPERAGRVLQRLGMTPYGSLYQMEV
jgi:hypothetical protein